MSRSALWRQQGNVQERERQAEEIFWQAVEEGKNNRARNLIPTRSSDDDAASSCFRMNPLLHRAIVRSNYFQKKCCQEIKDWNALVDEIYNQNLRHLEPWNSGGGGPNDNNKTPSTAFCLLLRLLTLKCSTKQMQQLLDHVDSPYIRCIGMLYLRYACEPDLLWNYLEPYLFDDEEVVVEAAKSATTSSSSTTTVGEFCRKLLTDLEYYNTRLPRLPIAVERDIKVKLLQAERIEQRALLHWKDSSIMTHFNTVGSQVRALYGDEENPTTWYDAVVDRVILRDDETNELLKHRSKYVVTFPEYGNTEIVTLGEMDMPDGRNSSMEAVSQEGSAARGRHDDGRRGRYDDEGDGRRRGGQKGYHDRRGRGGYGAQDGRRDRGYGPPPPPRRGPRNDDGWSRDGGGGRRDRSRSRDRDIRPVAAAVPSERDLMEEVLRQEREQVTAKGRAYASRPPSTKASLTAHGQSSGRKRSPPPPYSDRRGDARGGGSHGGSQRPGSKPAAAAADPAVVEAPPAPARPKTAQELAAIAEKKRKLMAKYG